MLRIVSAFAVASIALLVAALPASAQLRWQETVSADGDFSFSMPGKPNEQRQSGTHYNLPSQSLVYVSSLPGLPFIFAGRTSYHRDASVPARDELQGNADNFAKSISGKLISQRFFTWSGDGKDSYEAHESTVDSTRGTFRQLYVIDGKNVYGVIAGPKTSDNEADIDRFFGSLRIRKR